MPLPAQPLPIFGVDSLLLRLPAQTRADLAWAKRPIQDGLRRLRSEPLTDSLVREVAATLDGPLGALRRAAYVELAANLDAYRAALMSDLARDEDALAAFVAEDEARDTLAWVTGLLRSVLMAIPAPPPADLAALSDDDWQRVGGQPLLAPYKAAIVALMAASEEARSGADPARARDLVDVAFLQMTAFSDSMRALGLHLSAFPYDTTEQRGQRAIASAQRLREALADADARVLDAARFTNLR